MSGGWGIPISWATSGPAVCVAAGAMLALVADLLLTRRTWWLSWLPMVAGVVLGFLELLRSVELDRIHANSVGFQFSAIILVATLLVLALSALLAEENAMPAGEFQFLIGSAAAGGLVMVMSEDFVTLLVGLELLALPSIALVGLRSGDRRAISTAWTFFLTSVVSTAIALMGFALLYGLTGSLEFASVRDLEVVGAAHSVAHGPLAVAVVLTLVGLLFKLGAVPFHAWVPDAYRGASPVVTAFLATVSKSATIAGLAVILYDAFEPYRSVWVPVIAVFAAVSMTIGNVGALRQSDGIGVLAWSSVAHAGFLLAPLGAMHAMSATPLLQYLAIYVLANLVAFGAVAVVLKTRGSASYSDLTGLARTDPWVGVPLAFALLTLAGFPPAVIGLVAKYVVFAAVVSEGPLWLAVVMAINVMIGLAYYLRLVAVLFATPEERAPVSFTGPSGVKVATIVVLTLGVALIVLSAWPSFLLDHVVAPTRLAG
jgi:NADH-quinone oxidoreductase subunit N